MTALSFRNLVMHSPSLSVGLFRVNAHVRARRFTLGIVKLTVCTKCTEVNCTEVHSNRRDALTFLGRVNVLEQIVIRHSGVNG